MFPALHWHCRVRSTQEEGESSAGSVGTRILPKRGSWEQLLTAPASGAQCPSDPHEPKAKSQSLSSLAAGGPSSLSRCHSSPGMPGHECQLPAGAGRILVAALGLERDICSLEVVPRLGKRGCSPSAAGIFPIPPSLPVEGTSCYPIPISLPVLHFQPCWELQDVFPSPSIPLLQPGGTWPEFGRASLPPKVICSQGRLPHPTSCHS